VLPGRVLPMSGTSWAKWRAGLDWVAKRCTVEGAGRAVLWVLAYNADKETGIIKVGTRKIAAEAGISQRHVITLLLELVESGCLEVVTVGRGRSVSTYRLSVATNSLRHNPEASDEASSSQTAPVVTNSRPVVTNSQRRSDEVTARSDELSSSTQLYQEKPHPPHARAREAMAPALSIVDGVGGGGNSFGSKSSPASNNGQAPPEPPPCPLCGEPLKALRYRKLGAHDYCLDKIEYRNGEAQISDDQYGGLEAIAGPWLRDLGADDSGGAWLLRDWMVPAICNEPALAKDLDDLGDDGWWFHGMAADLWLRFRTYWPRVVLARPTGVPCLNCGGMRADEYALCTSPMCVELEKNWNGRRPLSAPAMTGTEGRR